MKETIQDQISKVALKKDPEGKYFGHNIDWEIEQVFKYVNKLNKLGCTDFSTPNYWTLKFTAPIRNSEVLLYILSKGIMPSTIQYKRVKNLPYVKLTLYWDF